jgi:hypothetical protein
VTYQEPERLALRLQALLERRTVVRAALERDLEDSDRNEHRVALESIDQEADALARRLGSLRAGLGGGGTG